MPHCAVFLSAISFLFFRIRQPDDSLPMPRFSPKYNSPSNGEADYLSQYFQLSRSSVRSILGYPTGIYVSGQSYCEVYDNLSLTVHYDAGDTVQWFSVEYPELARRLSGD
jgi:hypothetical protein